MPPPADRKALVLTSMGGREHMYGPASVHGGWVNGMLRHILEGMLENVGYTVYEPFIAYHVPYVTQEARCEVLGSLADQVRRLSERPTLKLPSLEDFDAEFTPARQ